MICIKLGSTIVLIVKLLRGILIIFCKDNNYKVVTMYSPIEYYVIVVFKEIEDENKGKRDN